MSHPPSPPSPPSPPAPSDPPTSSAALPAKPAGGWSALGSSLSHLVQHKAITRGAAALLKVNQPAGFDCPGCAWPEPTDGQTSAFEFCENGVKAVSFEATAKRVDPAFFARHRVAELRKQTDHWLENQGRLTHPMRYNRQTDRYEPIGWDEAFELVGQKLRQLANPHQAAFYTSGRTSNEAAFLYQLMGRMFGTNNFPDCSNMCHESSGYAMIEQMGVGKGTVRIEDFDLADAIFIIGQNPGTNHPRMLSTLEKAARRGAKIVTINPLREPGLVSFIHPQQPLAMLTGQASPISTHYEQVLIGGDLAALKGVIKHLLNSEADQPGSVLDHDFIARHTTGFDAFAADVTGTSWEEIESQCGLGRDRLKVLADVYQQARRVIVCWAMGLTQHKHAVPTIQMIGNLLLLGGHIGRPGAGACPVRGHSNVQGDRTVGITERPDQAFLDALGRVFGFEPPREHGLDVVGSIDAMARGQVKVFIALGGNFAAATPDSIATATALSRCDLTVQISTKLNRSHTIVGHDALILPCLGRTERDIQAGGLQQVTVEDSMSQVHASAGRLTPASKHLKSEPAIVAGMAAATLGSEKVDWDALASDYSRIRDRIAAVLPGLFADYNQRIQAKGGFFLGNPARDRRWQTPSGKAHFFPHAIPDLTLPPGQLRMMTIRSHDQFNTTVYGLHDRYRGIFNTRMVILMNPRDMANRGIPPGAAVSITSHTQEDGSIRQAAGFFAHPYDIPAGCCAMYFPEANVLVSKDSYARHSRTPLSKFVPVTVEANA